MEHLTKCMPMSYYASDVSMVVLPITVPLDELQVALDAQLPHKLTEITQMQELMDGQLMVQISGLLNRAGTVQLEATQDGFCVVIPMQAACMVTPMGLKSVTRAVVGEAQVRFWVTPRINSQWETEFGLRSEYVWTSPIGREVLMGVSIDLQPIIDLQLAQQLVQLTATLRQTTYRTLRLRERLEQLWANYHSPRPLNRQLLGLLPAEWAQALPPLFSVLQPEAIELSPLNVRDHALCWTAAFTFECKIVSQQTDFTVTPINRIPAPLVELTEAEEADMLDQPSQIDCDIEINYERLSAWLTNQLREQIVPLPLAWLKRVKLLNLAIAPASLIPSTPSSAVDDTDDADPTEDPTDNPELCATLLLEILEPPGLQGLQPLNLHNLRGKVKVDLHFSPQLTKHTLSVKNLKVTVHQDDWKSRILARFLNDQTHSELMDRLRYDLGPYIRGANVAARGIFPHQWQLTHLPFTIELTGQMDDIQLAGLQVRQEDLVLQLHADGQGALQLKSNI